MKPRLLSIVPASVGAVDVLAEIHSTAFADPWSAADFDVFLRQVGVSGWVIGNRTAEGFILIRRAAEEAEILTLAVQPAARRTGLARNLLEHALESLREHGTGSCFLEVAVDNAAARALYAGAGFDVCGKRRDYYDRGNGMRADAIVMRRDL